MRWVDDPEPDGYLPSDVAFGAWLDGLDPRKVLREVERGGTPFERAQVRWLREKAARSRATPSSTDDG